MEAALTQTKRTKANLDRLLFNVPTAITKLEPIFTFNFNITETPSVTINLNPTLKKSAKKIKKNRFMFDESGYCNISFDETEGYFLKAELKLINMIGDEVSHCKMRVDYGKGESEQFLLNGTFNLTDFIRQ